MGKATAETEAILRSLALLGDASFRVRDKAAEMLQHVGRAHVEAALEVDASALALGDDKVAIISRVQTELRRGYEQFMTSCASGRTAEIPQGIPELGYAIRLSYWCSESVSALGAAITELSPNVRCLLVRSAQRAIEAAVGAVRSCATDLDSGCRALSWSALSSLTLEIKQWQKLLPNAVRDADEKVRQASLYHLGWSPVRQVVSTVVGVSQDREADAVRCEALHALETLVWAAQAVYSIDERVLRDFLRDLDDATISTEVRMQLLGVLSAFAKMFLRERPEVDWARIAQSRIE